MSTDRWIDFWQAYCRDQINVDEQTQVLRTSSGQPATPALWRLTLDDVSAKLPMGTGDDLLDLCCGNGLFTRHFAPLCNSVVSVDICAELLDSLNRIGLPNVTTRREDVRQAMFPEGAFSRILLYSAIQYLSEGETVILFRKLFRWLRPGGILLVGDVPDRNCLWSFYNTAARRDLYFENCAADRDVVGTWYDGEWLERLARTVGFQHCHAAPQPPGLIYAHFRFDLQVIRSAESE